MVPAAIVEPTLDQLVPLLEPGDTVIDGGNSYYRDDIARAKQLAPKGIHYLDCGTSGGVWGLERGYCLMIGGETEAVRRLDPIFKTIAPGTGERRAHPAPDPAGGTAPEGYLHCGPNGAGHFVKMVHNGVEYGMMAAIAEGLSIIKHANVGEEKQDVDAETTPLRDPGAYQYDIDVAEVAEVWRRGSVVGVVAGRPHRRRVRALAGPRTTSPAGSRTPARAGGRCSPPSTRAFPPRSSPRRSTSASSREAWGSSPARSSRPCAASSAVTPSGSSRPGMQHELETLPDAAAVAAAGAAFVAELAREAVAADGVFHFAVSGGHTPWAMFAELAQQHVPWDSVVIYQVDERVAPPDDPDRNLSHLAPGAGRGPGTSVAHAGQRRRPRGRGGGLRGLAARALRPRAPGPWPRRAHRVARAGRSGPGGHRPPGRPHPALSGPGAG